jgi:hypothetical protein
MKTSILCDRCEGTGDYRGLGICIRCQGRGILTRDRLLFLRDEYWPNRFHEGKISELAASNEIFKVENQLQELDEPERESVVPLENFIDGLPKISLASSVYTVKREAEKQGGKLYVKFG